MKKIIFFIIGCVFTLSIYAQTNYQSCKGYQTYHFQYSQYEYQFDLANGCGWPFGLIVNLQGNGAYPTDAKIYYFDSRSGCGFRVPVSLNLLRESTTSKEYIGSFNDERVSGNVSYRFGYPLRVGDPIGVSVSAEITFKFRK